LQAWQGRRAQLPVAHASYFGFSGVPAPSRSSIVPVDLLFYAAVFAAVFILGLGKGGFSGVGLIATPLLALVVPPLQAAAILLPVLLLQDIVSVWAYRRDWDAWNLKVLLPGSILGVIAGWAFAAQVSDAQMRLALGLISVAFALNAWFGKKNKPAYRPGMFSGLFWGAGCGFTSMISHAGGPPFYMHMLPQKLDRITFAATSAVFFALVNVMKLGPFLSLGQLTQENLLTSALFAPLAVASNFLGIWLVRIISNEMFYRIIYVIVFVIGLELIRGGIMGIFAS
jgi:uncharacterized membrane protein YfcA